MWLDLTEWVGSRERHVTGFTLGLNYEHKSVEFETRHSWTLQHQGLHNIVIRSVYHQSSTCDKSLV